MTVKPVHFDLTHHEVTVWPFRLAYRETVRMAQGREKDRWPVLLTANFGSDSEYSNLPPGSLTFEYYLF